MQQTRQTAYLLALLFWLRYQQHAVATAKTIARLDHYAYIESSKTNQRQQERVTRGFEVGSLLRPCELLGTGTARPLNDHTKND